MSQNKELIVDLILPVPLNQLFSYSVPELLHHKCSIGKRAVVQFGKKKVYSALIANIHHNIPDKYPLKEIVDIIDDHPVVNEIQIKFWHWMAEYYMSTIGEVYKAALPAGLRLESNTNIIYHEDFFARETNLKTVVFTNRETAILDALASSKVLTINEIISLINVKNCLPQIKSLYDKGAIWIDEELEKGFKARTEKYVRLTTEFNSDKKLNEFFSQSKRAQNQLKLITCLLDLTEFCEGTALKSISIKLLLKKSQTSSSIITSLLKKGVIEIFEKEISRLELTADDKKTGDLPLLNDTQNEAYDKIINLFTEKETVLLHGITSSGKTEIYIKLINKYLNEGKQILYLLPEIALTSQMVDRLRKAFGSNVGVYHSKYSDYERVEIWNNISGNRQNDSQPNYKIILGVRSSIFLPFNNLGLIIIDEEHENTYKQFNPSPRYHARDAALMLARMYNAKSLLGSATPCLESYFNSNKGKYGLVNLNQRYLNIPLPEIIVADVKEARRKKQMKSHFTPILLNHITEALKLNEQVILFQNRRGFALYIECFECGWIPKCDHCDVCLTYHKHTNSLICHYCGYSCTILNECHECKSKDLRTRGFGTEKVEDELKQLFPDARIRRMDMDSARGKKAHSQIISEIENHQVDIIVGTQMISKGLDFENVSLVGILDANQMLNFPDFRAYERSYQLMAQVGGRAGRKNKRGKVVIQTTTPNNPIIHCVIKNDFENMFRSQASERKTFKYPPFCRLIFIILKHRDKIILDQASDFFSDNLKIILKENVIGPEYPIIGKTFDQYLKSILLKIENLKLADTYKKLILDTEYQMTRIEKFKAIQIVYDVDPY